MKKGILLSLTLLFCTVAFAQERTISGVVTDSTDGKTLPGVNVYVESTTIGTSTNIDGKYQLEVPEETKQLVFSYVGYQEQIVNINDRTRINVQLVPTVESIDEVVVIGYGTQKKSLVTGSISKVSVDDLTQDQSRIEQSLQGKTAGVNIMQESGSPGGDLTIRIRGTGTNRNANPLFIVDGMRTDGMEYLNPDDIESVEILKDAASAAIYGAAAANGVVLITTKSGKSGESKVNYNYSYGLQSAANTIDVLNAKQYATYFREGRRHEILSQYPPGTNIPEELMNTLIDKAYPFNPDTLGTGTDWMNEIFQVAPMEQHNLSIQGGTEKTKVYSSASYLNQDGIVGGSKANFNRITARLNLDHEVKDWFDIGTNISFTHYKRKELNENNEFGGVISNAMAIDPLTPLYVDELDDLPSKYLQQIENNIDNPENSSLRAPGDKGYYGMSRYVQNEIANPVAQINNDHGRWTQDKVVAGFFTNIEPFKGFSIRTTYDIDMAYGTYQEWTPQYFYHAVNNNYLTSTTQTTERWFTWQLENVAKYNMEIGDHSMNFMAGMTNRDYRHYLISGRGEVMQEESWNFATLNSTLSDTVRRAASGYRDESRLLSYFGRVQYNYQEKYMLNATFRADGSSKLALGNKFRYFPSVSVGWVISNEDFQIPDYINFLKLRASWGRNGNIGSLGNFEYVSVVRSNAETSYYLSGGTKLTGAEPVQIANPDLVWESSDQIDVGLDVYLFDSQITFSADYFKKTTIDLITEGPIAYYVGNNPPSSNAGDIVNQGVELELGFKKRIGDFSLDIKALASSLKNEVTYIGNEASSIRGANLGTTGEITRSEEGRPIWFFYGYEADGIFNDREEVSNYTNDDGELIQPNAIAGDIKFKDINEDGKISEADKTMIGNPHPKWNLSLNSTLTYKNFDLNLFFNARLGADVYFGAYRTDLNMNNKPEFFYDEAWTPDNKSADFPRLTAGDSNPGNFSHNSMFVFDGSFLRLQNVELGYTLPDKLMGKAGIDKLRIYLSGENVFLLSKYPGDPELGNSGGVYGNSIGVDRGLYPRARVISFGANLTF
jgi:TonB-linked SusC/RagA family outer membrane protein